MTLPSFLPLLSSPSEPTLRANDDVTPSASTFSPPHRATPSQTQTHTPENEHVHTRFSTLLSNLTEILYPPPEQNLQIHPPLYYYDIQSNHIHFGSQGVVFGLDLCDRSAANWFFRLAASFDQVSDLVSSFLLLYECSKLQTSYAFAQAVGRGGYQSTLK